jgi:GMP synthase (glutamine-hydrolysing)
MSSIVVVQHVLAEGIGRIEPLLRDCGIDIDIVRPDAELDPTAVHKTSGVIILGGPMSVYDADRYPRLRVEMQLIENALKSQIPILGLCLGSQLLAAALGSQVRPGPSKELGWYEVTPEDRAKGDLLFKGMPARFKALHWHGDIFDLPSGALHLARSAMTKCQAFSYGTSAWGLLFHLEAGIPEVQAMTAAFPDEIRASGTNPEDLMADTVREEPETARLASTLFGEWVQLVKVRDPSPASTRTQR